MLKERKYRQVYVYISSNFDIWTFPKYTKAIFFSEVAITLCFQLCSECYTTLQIKNILRSTSAVIMEIWTISVTNVGKPSCAIL